METGQKQWLLFLEGKHILKRNQIAFLDKHYRKLYICYDSDTYWPDKHASRTFVWFPNCFNLMQFMKARSSLEYAMVSHMLIGMVMADKEYLPLMMSYSRVLDPYTFKTYTDPPQSRRGK